MVTLRFKTVLATLALVLAHGCVDERQVVVASAPDVVDAHRDLASEDSASDSPAEARDGPAPEPDAIADGRFEPDPDALTTHDADVSADLGAGDPEVGEPEVGEPPTALSILFIGNSFTFGGPIPRIVDDLAVDAGWPDPDVDSETVGGYSLARHRDRSETVAAVDRGGWDVVVLQEFSTGPTDGLGNPEQFKADATWFHDRIRETSPGARIVLYETWARHADHAYYPGSFDDPADMQAQLRFHYDDCAERYIPENADLVVEPSIEVAPAGDAWEAHLQSDEPLRLHHTDDWHAGSRGQYLNGLVIYSTIYHRATAGRTPLGRSIEDARVLQAVADATTGETRLGGPPGGPITGLRSGQQVRIDFGATLTSEPGWSNLTNPTSGRLVNVVDAGGAVTTVDLAVTDGFSGANDQGLSENDLGYPAEVSRDQLWIGSFDGHEASLSSRGQVAIRGLEPEATYRLTLFAARAGTDSGNGRLTRYIIGGESIDLEVADNRSEAAEFEAVSASALGEIVVDVTVSPAGTGRFGYIGAMILERLP
jgi:hypothetical protein